MRVEVSDFREMLLTQLTKGDHAIFGFRGDGTTFELYDQTTLDMVMGCFDRAVEEYESINRLLYGFYTGGDYCNGGVPEKDRAPSAKVDAPMREGDSDA